MQPCFDGGMRIFVLSILLAISTAAHAQRAPDMSTLDRGDGISKLGLDLAFSSIDHPFYSAALRFEIHGQYVTDSGLGFYGALPISRSFGADDEPANSPDNATALGNLDAGLLFVIESSPTISWVFRGGVAFPTAADDVDGATTNAFATYPRLTDVALTVPDAWYVRLGVSPLLHVNRFFLQADVGFDIGLDDEDDLADELFRLNVGAGYDFGAAALSLELVNVYTLDEFDDDDEFISTLAVTVRFMGEQLQPFLTVGTPVDDVRESVPFFVAGGLKFAF